MIFVLFVMKQKVKNTHDTAVDILVKKGHLGGLHFRRDSFAYDLPPNPLRAYFFVCFLPGPFVPQVRHLVLLAIAIIYRRN